MLSLLTLLIASFTVVAVAQPADAEPTKVTKLNPDTIQIPCHTASANIHARQLAESSPSPIPTWSEPSWMLYGVPTATPSTLFTAPRSGSYPDYKEDNVNKIVFIAVLSTAGGSMILFGIVGCIIKACMQRSSKGEDKGESKGKGKDKRKHSADVEMTAGLTANATAPAEGYYAPQPRRFEEMEEVVLTPKYPRPVYRTNVPPQSCHYPEGEGR